MSFWKALRGDEAPEAAMTPAPEPDAVAHVCRAYKDAGQGHVAEAMEALAPGSPEATSLYDQMRQVDPAKMAHVFAAAQEFAKREQSRTSAASGGDASTHIEPLPQERAFSKLDSTPETIQEWKAAGLAEIAASRVAVIEMAGGQGTRLGSGRPKGCFNIGLPSQKSLFQLHAERLRRLCVLAGGHCHIPWYIMTSDRTRDATMAFFEEHAYFGLARDTVVFFEQGVLPVMTSEGSFLMENAHELALAPNGNGGMYEALLTQGVLMDMRQRGIKHIHTFSVDNCLVRPADPVFVGMAARERLDVATKVVRKRDAAEPVGLIVLRDGAPGVVEYSEIPTFMAQQTVSGADPPLLKFRAANIVNHYYSFDFLSDFVSGTHELPYHIARKRQAFYSVEKSRVEAAPAAKEPPNCCKMEMFVFDIFPFVELDRFASFEVGREDEFSPVKNAADGQGRAKDTPETARRDLLAQGHRWVTEAGAVVTGESDAIDAIGVEVSPLVSYAGEGLAMVKGREIRGPAVIDDAPPEL